MSLSVLSTSKEPTTSNMLETNNIIDGNSQLVVMNIKTTTTTTVTTNSNNDDTDSKFFKHLDKNLFTFKPKLNAKSNLIAQNFSSFLERQSMHSTKKLELVKQIS